MSALRPLSGAKRTLSKNWQASVRLKKTDHVPDRGADRAVIVLGPHHRKANTTLILGRKAAEPRAGEPDLSVKAALQDRQPRSGQWRYGRTLYTTSCSRACWTTFRPKSAFGPTSVAGA
jgi:hypothetical protein